MADWDVISEMPAAPSNDRTRPAKAGEWDVVSEAPGEKSKFAKFMGREVGQLAGQPKDQGFPFDKPGTEYGDILPFAKDTGTGQLSIAVPEMIRAPVRGMVMGGMRARGVIPESVPTQPDEVGALLALSGTPGATSVASGTGRAVAAASERNALRTITTPARAAQEAGYVLPPPMTGEGGTVGNALAGWGGKAKIAQAASTKNQEVTNRLAAKSLGLPEDTTLTEGVFNAVRERAGQAYQAVAAAIPRMKIDDAFRQEVGKIGDLAKPGEEFLSIKNPAIDELKDSLAGLRRDPRGRVMPSQEASTESWINKVRQLRSDAKDNFRAHNIQGDPARRALAEAQQSAADAIDNMIERRLAEAGSPELSAKYVEARRLIAKSHDVENAANSTTGDVSARALARSMERGRPLSGELKTIADAANAFPRAFQSPTQFGGNEPLSVLDVLGTVTAAAHGRADLMGMFLGRPIAREVALSRLFQNRATTALPPPGPVNMLARTAAPPVARMNMLAPIPQQNQ